jgi:hypothetical protein
MLPLEGIKVVSIEQVEVEVELDRKKRGAKKA